MLTRRCSRIVTLTAVAVSAGESAAQSNLGFETWIDGAPAGWTLDARDAAAFADAEEAHEGTSVRIDAAAASASLRLSQELDVTGFAGKRIRIEARVRQAGGEPADARLSLRIGTDAGFLYRGTPAVYGEDAGSGWRTVASEAVIARQAATLRIALSVETAGTAWLDSVRIVTIDPDARPAAASRAARYLEWALDVLEANSINRRQIDWPALRAAARASARGAVSERDTYASLRFAIAELGDGHSYLQTAERLARLGPGPVSNARSGRPAVAPLGTALGGGAAYLAVPGFARGTQRDQAEFAGGIQALIETLDAAASCGWIVDLRANAGGNLWPMLAGLGPLLGNGEIGAAVQPDGSGRAIWYEDGKAGLGDYVQLRIRQPAYALAKPGPRIAVLTSGRTASSAEVLVAAFASLPHSQSFGAPTRGLVTGTKIFDLSDGASIVLAVAATRDRDGAVLSGPIAPDVAVAGPRRPRWDASQSSPDPADPAVAAALAWLRRQPGCG